MDNFINCAFTGSISFDPLVWLIKFSEGIINKIFLQPIISNWEWGQTLTNDYAIFVIHNSHIANQINLPTYLYINLLINLYINNIMKERGVIYVKFYDGRQCA